jgi:hypothetical protein
VFHTHRKDSVKSAVDAQEKCRTPVDHHVVRGGRDASLRRPPLTKRTTFSAPAIGRSAACLDTAPIGYQDDVWSKHLKKASLSPELEPAELPAYGRLYWTR